MKIRFQILCDVSIVLKNIHEHCGRYYFIYFGPFLQSLKKKTIASCSNQLGCIYYLKLD